MRTKKTQKTKDKQNGPHQQPGGGAQVLAKGKQMICYLAVSNLETTDASIN
jgi:hypothetical protein